MEDTAAATHSGRSDLLTPTGPTRLKKRKLKEMDSEQLMGDSVSQCLCGLLDAAGPS